MISRLTKVQLIIFAIVTVLGGAFVGGRYAQIDRLVVDRTYPVTAQFEDSGGIFAGAQVTYRGIGVGKVKRLEFAGSGVVATLDIENSAPKIPDDVKAIVANKSAIGEQFIDLQPRGNEGPYLAKGSTITLANTAIPIDTTTLLVDVNDLVKSVNTDSLRTVVDELGQAFEGTGRDLGTILDTSSEFITTADDNIDVTRALIRDSDSVLQTQIDKSSEIANFSKNLALLSDSLVNADPDLRRLLDKGSVSARTLNNVVDENSKNLGSAVNDLITANRPLKENIVGLQAIFILYPYLVQGSFSALEEDGDTGNYDAHFGLVLQDMTPTCTFREDPGYRPRRAEADIGDDEPLNPSVDCKLPDNNKDLERQAKKTDLDNNRSAASSDTGARASEGPTATGKDSWKWLLSDPVTQ